MLVKKTENKIEITFKYNPYLLQIVKSLPLRTYNPRTKSWFIPFSNAEKSIDILKAKGFHIDPDLSLQLVRDKEQAQQVEQLARQEDTVFESALPLYNFQRVGASFLDKVGSGLLGDEPGAGKTLQVMAVCNNNNAKKVLVFCPSVLKHQWAGEIRKFLPGIPVVVIEGNLKQRASLWNDSQNVVYFIVNYEQLLRDFEHMNMYEWDYIIADEATKISSHSAKQSKAIKKLRAKNRIAMTGTPISNTAQNIWNLMDFCNPGSFGNYYNFLFSLFII